MISIQLLRAIYIERKALQSNTIRLNCLIIVIRFDLMFVYSDSHLLEADDEQKKWMREINKFFLTGHRFKLSKQNIYYFSFVSSIVIIIVIKS